MTRQEKARQLFLSGYNCSQSVFAAFCDKTGIDEEKALQISAGLGGGVGRQREVCGAVSGAAMVIGTYCSAKSGDDEEGKMKNYELVTQFIEKFKAMHGSMICRELLADTNATISGTVPDARTMEYYKDRPCLRLVENAVCIVEEMFED